MAIQVNAQRKKPVLVSQDFQFYYRTIAVQTRQQNLTEMDPRLSEFVKPNDFFFVHNLTETLKDCVGECSLTDGVLTAQILHTSATLIVNELDEPMLLADLARKTRLFAPKEESYHHNGPMRTVNLCQEDTHCDRNGDAHVKASLFGMPSVSLIVRDGSLVLGQWQKVALVEFDGPRPREVLVQIMGR